MQRKVRGECLRAQTGRGRRQVVSRAQSKIARTRADFERFSERSEN